jgi:nucleotide-binding universal stress UspA family protein
MHVVDSAPYSVTDTFKIVEHRRSLETIARSLLDSWTAPLLKKNLSAKPYLANGIVHREILEKARHDRADLIVMGTHGRTGLEHVLLGSVAEKVVRLSGCPVLTVPVSGSKKPRPAKSRRRRDVILI